MILGSFKKKLAGLAVVLTLVVQSGVVFANEGYVYGDFIERLWVSEQSFDVRAGESVDIECEVNEDGFRSLVIEDSRGRVVREFRDYRGQFFREEVRCEESWNGRDDDGERVEEGVYYVEFDFEDVDGYGETVSRSVIVSEERSSGSGPIESVDLDPSGEWDPSVEDLEIDVDLITDVDFLYIYMQRSVYSGGERFNDFVELIDEEDLDRGDYSFRFDGTYENGDYLAVDDWELVVLVDGYSVKKSIEVDYEQPEFLEVFVTKDSFDPSVGQKMHVVVKTNVTSFGTIELDRGSRTERFLADEDEWRKNHYYVYEWDGYDRNGDLAIDGESYEFKIRAEHRTDDDVFEREVIRVDVEDFDFDYREANITEDYMEAVVEDEGSLYFCLDEDAEVTVTVHEGSSTGGRAELEVLDDYLLEEGCHTIDGWELEEDNGKRLSDGIYSYKITSENEDGRRQVQTGRFAVGDLERGDNSGNDDDKPYYGESCGGYIDTVYINDQELCDAIEAVTDWGIFSGYEDGSFGVYNPINRAETLKVLAGAHRDKMNVMSANGSNAGFGDLIGREYSWPMGYVLTGVANGYFEGYWENGVRKAGLNRTINRAEVLKLVLETSNRFGDLNFTTSGNGYAYSDVNYGDWFAGYAGVAYDYVLFDERVDMYGVSLDPGKEVTRGEVALLLYRMHENGLDNFILTRR